MKERFILPYRSLLFLLAFVGVYLEIAKFGWGMLMYYTVLSNVLVLLFTGYLLFLMRRSRKDWSSAKLLRVKGGVTMCIMITCVVYHFLLASKTTDFHRLENYLCHYIVPLGFLLDTLIFDKTKQYRWYDPIAWTLLPIIYMVFALFNGLVTKLPIPDSKDNPFPYFFLNVNKFGWAYVVRMCLIIFGAYLLSGFIFYGIKLIWGRKNE
ncbi:Pr6Pr family membrane protein [Streptococcus oricebi]|uniref:Pr6Pr family membrane protein n=1 Tax=Streptococcus oricebi TaxID=1547447 RepID=A0ABS5B2V3_9STRE|nr:Pr6Pr family membrane protein [Streptococcus oricebi]MBP2623155.1 hypothetical protein [Streptococcus oricebi]